MFTRSNIVLHPTKHGLDISRVFTRSWLEVSPDQSQLGYLSCVDFGISFIVTPEETVVDLIALSPQFQ